MVMMAEAPRDGRCGERHGHHEHVEGACSGRAHRMTKVTATNSRMAAASHAEPRDLAQERRGARLHLRCAQRADVLCSVRVPAGHRAHGRARGHQRALE